MSEHTREPDILNAQPTNNAHKADIGCLKTAPEGIFQASGIVAHGGANDESGDETGDKTGSHTASAAGWPG